MKIREKFLIVLVILYIIIMLFVLYSFSSNKEWRLPTYSCPDFWIKDGDNCCNYRNKDVNNQCVKFDLSDENFCDTVKMIYKNNYTWDGITYGFGKTAPCTPLK